MAYVTGPMPPEAYANPWVAGAVTMDMIYLGIRSLLALIRRKREVRMLERITVLPPEWDSVGRY